MKIGFLIRIRNTASGRGRVGLRIDIGSNHRAGRKCNCGVYRTRETCAGGEAGGGTPAKLCIINLDGDCRGGDLEQDCIKAEAIRRSR